MVSFIESFKRSLFYRLGHKVCLGFCTTCQKNLNELFGQPSWSLSKHLLSMDIYQVIWCEQLTHCKSPWWWERSRAEGEVSVRMRWLGWHHWCSGHELGQTMGDRDREAWHAAVHRVAKSQTRLGDWTITTYTRYHARQRRDKQDSVLSCSI